MNVTVRCPAKVNLHLEVLGKRPDGYHELRTLFAAVGIWDELELRLAAPGCLELAVEPAGSVPAGADNLVLRAARALQARHPGGPGAHIVLRKRIPVAGGMGGGSSNAAAALVGLCSLWGWPADFPSLHPVAASLGADVPFFLLGGAAWGVGRGDEVYPLPDLPPFTTVALPGPYPVPTAEIYRALQPAPAGGPAVAEWYHWAVAGGDLPWRNCRNDLEATVVARYPEVGRRLEALRNRAATMSMVSGSGGTVYGVYPDAARAREAAAVLGEFAPVVAPLLARADSRLRPVARED
jgi:4-diphosphocytidyl-2-C-methyl-D-erythritol kinase